MKRRRMKRRLLNGITILSLALFVAVVVLWGRSYWVADTFSTARGALVSLKGRFGVLRSYGAKPDYDPGERGYHVYDPDMLNYDIAIALQPNPLEWSIGDSFSYMREANPGQGMALVVFPHWSVVLAAAAAP